MNPSKTLTTDPRHNRISAALARIGYRVRAGVIAGRHVRLLICHREAANG